MPLSEQWRLTFSGDISGGDTEGTFSVGAYAGYRMGQHHFIGGYKHFEMDLESGGGGDLTVTMTGPVIAYGSACDPRVSPGGKQLKNKVKTGFFC